MNEKTKAPVLMEPSFPWDHDRGPTGQLGGARPSTMPDAEQGSPKGPSLVCVTLLS